jgi:hypothetical protein
MGKASSNKKVARAAGTGGGRTGKSNTPWTYVGLIGLIVVVGLALTWTSRTRFEHQRSGSSSTAAVAPKVGGTAWNEGFGVYVCGTWQAPLKKATTTTGLSPQGNGVIHIAPKTKAVAGKNATLGNFAKSVKGFTLTSDSIQLPGGKLYKNGDKCDGKTAQLYVKEYTYIGQAAGVIQTTSAPDIRLANGALLTVAFVPPSQKDSITSPPESVQSALKDTTTTTTTTTTSTVPASTTTVASSTTTSSKSTSTTAKSTSTTGKSTSTTTKSSSKSKSKS